jgi:hypothetical protein
MSTSQGLKEDEAEEERERGLGLRSCTEDQKNEV